MKLKIFFVLIIFQNIIKLSSGKLKDHINSMSFTKGDTPFCYPYLAGAVVASWSLTQEVAGLKNLFKIHECIRMQTTRSLPYRGVSLTETPLDRDPPWTETPLDRDPSGQRPLWTETPRTDILWTEIPPGQRPPDRDPLDRNPRDRPPCSSDLWCMLGQKTPCEQND